KISVPRNFVHRWLRANRNVWPATNKDLCNEANAERETEKVVAHLRTGRWAFKPAGRFPFPFSAGPEKGATAWPLNCNIFAVSGRLQSIEALGITRRVGVGEFEVAG